MALVTNALFGADDQKATVSYTYDTAQTNLITTVHATNTSPAAICGTIKDQAGATLWTGRILPLGQTPTGQDLAPGDYDVSAAGIHMISITAFGHTFLVPGASATCGWPC